MYLQSDIVSGLQFPVVCLRWFVLKDSYLVYIRSDKNTIAGVLLFDAGTMVTTGPSHTGLVNGLLVGTRTRCVGVADDGS